MASRRSQETATDPRFAEVLAAFARDPRLAAIARAFAADHARGGAKKFGANALKLEGKIFAMLVRGRLVVKLAKERVDELVATHAGEYFDPGHGRLMKQWVVITSDDCSWVALAKEAHQVARRAS
jgi:hypothetical protein